MAFHGVQLPDGAADRLLAGAPTLALAELGDRGGLEPGRPLRLLDRDGEVLASAVADPDNGVAQVLAREAVRAFDAGFFEARLAAALSVRRALGLVDAGVSSYRLVNGEGDRLPGLWADVYGPYAVVAAASRGLLAYARLLAQAIVDAPGQPVIEHGDPRRVPNPPREGAAAAKPPPPHALGVRGAVIKVRSKDPQDRSHKDEVLGERPAAKVVAHEHGVPFEVHLLGSLNVGLFCDMREHRRGLGRFVKGARVLNTFAYTGALSVAAARAGAAAVTSVDLSSGVLAWAKENFRLSGLDPDDARFRFEVSDVRRFMERERAAGTTYDTVILDPPTVSAARASQWSMKKDYPDLIALAARLLAGGGGFLWASANARKGAGVLAHVQEGLRRAGRPGAVIEVGGLPPDFPTPVDWPEARYLEVCQVWVGAA
jgi:23S rRNA (cytosine1962-C5)-methyltransferase